MKLLSKARSVDAKRVFALLFVSSVGINATAADLPESYDLRNVNGDDYISTVKEQQGGTCWTFATMAALESNLALTGTWEAQETGEPDLAEYHLDWWNGFNQHFNADIYPRRGGLRVHRGGDYRVAAAYLSRGGAVRNIDGQSYGDAPEAYLDTYHRFYVRDIEWHSAGSDLSNINAIKQAVIKSGGVGTALAWSNRRYSRWSNSFYQSPSSTSKPNHAVTIVGWDDNKATPAPSRGAWLIKNSWGTDWGRGGYFWISYHDKVAGKHSQMGAVSFRNVEPLRYDGFYYHDYHGWRDTFTEATEAINAFVAVESESEERLAAVSFYTAATDVTYEARVHREFADGQLDEAVAQVSGTFSHAGFHTVDLEEAVSLEAGEPFYIYLKLSHGGQPIDRTSEVPVLLCGDNSKALVRSTASAGESYFLEGDRWVDLTDREETGNFTIKGLTIH